MPKMSRIRNTARRFSNYCSCFEFFNILKSDQLQRTFGSPVRHGSLIYSNGGYHWLLPTLILVGEDDGVNRQKWKGRESARARHCLASLIGDDPGTCFLAPLVQLPAIVVLVAIWPAGQSLEYFWSIFNSNFFKSQMCTLYLYMCNVLYNVMDIFFPLD